MLYTNTGICCIFNGKNCHTKENRNGGLRQKRGQLGTMVVGMKFDIVEIN